MTNERNFGHSDSKSSNERSIDTAIKLSSCYHSRNQLLNVMTLECFPRHWAKRFSALNSFLESVSMSALHHTSHRCITSCIKRKKAEFVFRNVYGKRDVVIKAKSSERPFITLFSRHWDFYNKDFLVPLLCLSVVNVFMTFSIIPPTVRVDLRENKAGKIMNMHACVAPF